MFQGFDRNQRHMIVAVGRLTWTVTDRPAFDSMINAYARVGKLAELMMADPRPDR